ncbi:unnamed protein product [Brassica rapa subsp. trilocularis]
MQPSLSNRLLLFSPAKESRMARTHLSSLLSRKADAVETPLKFVS